MSDRFAFFQVLAAKIADKFRPYPFVQAVALGGSCALRQQDDNSDLNLYIFTTQPIPAELRDQILTQSGAVRSLGLKRPAWVDRETGIEIDLTVWDPVWIEEQIQRVIDLHQASLGNTTVFWHTIQVAEILYDKNGWLAALQVRCNQPYPEQLREKIIARNHAALRNNAPSYIRQLEKAVRRDDLISINHRITALLASYFDILFALNRALLPGETRLLSCAEKECPLRPPNMRADILGLLAHAAAGEEALHDANHLVDELDELLEQQGFDSRASQPRQLNPDEKQSPAKV